MKKIILFVLILGGLWPKISAQDSTRHWLAPTETLHKGRFWGFMGVGTAMYTGVTLSLQQLWYADYPRSRFHSFNDWPGWLGMDKAGHAFTAYFESKWAGHAFRWTGMPERHAVWAGALTGTLFQTTLEVLDGFSAEWGFSWGDVAFNSLGSGLYVGQHYLWNEQRIKLKLSSHRPNYSQAPLRAISTDTTSSLQARADALYGTTLPELFLKEYNGSTIWASVNIAAFTTQKPAWLPRWLNVAVGYGAENMFGAERNRWSINEGAHTFVAPAEYPRYRQLFLSLDVDLERIPTRHRWLKTLLGIANIIKIPAPTLEWNTEHGFKGHWLYF